MLLIKGGCQVFVPSGYVGSTPTTSTMKNVYEIAAETLAEDGQRKANEVVDLLLATLFGIKSRQPNKNLCKVHKNLRNSNTSQDIR